MLENIKMLLGISIEDTSKDNIINYWIKIYKSKIIKYCHINDNSELDEELINILEQIVINKMGGVGSETTGTPPVEKGVKSISRGDYTVTYFSGSESADSSSSKTSDDNFESFKSELNLYRRLDY